MMDVATNNLISWCRLSKKMSRKTGVTLPIQMGYIWVIVSILTTTLVEPAVAVTCPQRAVNGCFEQYNSHIQYHQGAHFYKDVEILRTICQSMQSAVHCTTRKCPGMSEDELKQVLPSDLTNVIELCFYPQIYEVYARNQFCFSQLDSSLDRCHENYQASTQHLVKDINTAHSPGVTPMCSELSKLVQCIELSVSAACSSEATMLVEFLVRPSIQHSQFCPKQAGSTTEPTTTPMVPTKSYNHRYHPEAPPDNVEDELENELSETGSHSNVAISSHVASLLFTALTFTFTRLVYVTM